MYDSPFYHDNVIRKSTVYVYGMWQYKLLSIKTLSQSKIIWRKLIGKTWVIYEDINKGKKLTEISSPLLHTNCRLETKK